MVKKFHEDLLYINIQMNCSKSLKESLFRKLHFFLDINVS